MDPDGAPARHDGIVGEGEHLFPGDQPIEMKDVASEGDARWKAGGIQSGPHRWAQLHGPAAIRQLLDDIHAFIQYLFSSVDSGSSTAMEHGAGTAVPDRQHPIDVMHTNTRKLRDLRQNAFVFAQVRRHSLGSPDRSRRWFVCRTSVPLRETPPERRRDPLRRRATLRPDTPPVHRPSPRAPTR